MIRNLKFKSVTVVGENNQQPMLIFGVNKKRVGLGIFNLGAGALLHLYLTPSGSGEPDITNYPQNALVLQGNGAGPDNQTFVQWDDPKSCPQCAIYAAFVFGAGANPLTAFEITEEDDGMQGR